MLQYLVEKYKYVILLAYYEVQGLCPDQTKQPLPSHNRVPQTLTVFLKIQSFWFLYILGLFRTNLMTQEMCMFHFFISMQTLFSIQKKKKKYKRSVCRLRALLNFLFHFQTCYEVDWEFLPFHLNRKDGDFKKSTKISKQLSY